MGASIYIKSKSAGNIDVPLAGHNEIKELWKPIIHDANLPLFDLCFSAGLSVDEGNYSEVLEEACIMLKAIESKVAFSADPGNPVFRSRRLLALLKAHAPKEGNQIYIG